MTRHLNTLLTLWVLLLPVSFANAKDINITVDNRTGAVSSMTIDGDASRMNWVLSPDGKQYKWVTDRYGWGLGYLTANGKATSWHTPTSTHGNTIIYNAGGNMQVVVTRSRDKGDIVERYVFKNIGKTRVRLTDCGIYTPWNDNYPDAATCMTSRCNAHIWAEGNAAYVCALRMGAGTYMSPDDYNIGLMLTEGELRGYEEWERYKKNDNSNFRGVISMDIPDMTLAPGKTYAVTWRIFTHKGKIDFEDNFMKRGGVLATSDKFVYQLGETAKVRLKGMAGEKTKLYKVVHTGEHTMRLAWRGGKTVVARLLGVSSYENIIGKRVGFIMRHQQMNDQHDLRYGAYMVYDNDTHNIYLNDDARASYDTDEGRERVGMGVLLAKWWLKHPNDSLKQSLIRYADFIKNRLQTDDYTTYSRTSKDGWNRGYNYAWVADFFFHMYLVTHDRQYALDGYHTLQALYRHCGYGFYCIGYPVTLSLRVLRDAGLHTEYAVQKACYEKTADIFAKNNLKFPKSEVNFEQAIIAPTVQFLLELYLQTKEQRYLDTARKMMPALENLCGMQPDYRLHDIAIRHWDCYWFGKRQLFGDTFPHYWTTINANAYYYYALATDDNSYMAKAREIVRNNLCNVFEDGSASCAFVYPRRINGEPAHFADAFANDQDWALVAYMLVEENI